MKRVAPDFCWLGLGLLTVLLVLAVCGPVMRERDQAALLEGALKIARSGDFSNQEFYNYDKQFLSYWIVGGAIRLMGLEGVGADPAALVSVGNRCAALFFSAGLLFAFARAPRRDLSFMPVLLLVLLTPSLLFSVPFLSSNIFAAAFLLVLAALMRKRHAGWGNAVFCGLFTALAVASRSDTVLVLPFLCLLGSTRFTIGGVLRERRHWIMLLATVGALGLGYSLTRGAYEPGFFFDIRLFGAFLVFGMAGAAVLLFWLPLRLVTSGFRRAWFLRAATGLAMLLPFAFYALLLYSPRHLLLSTLVLLLALLLPRGERWWQVLQRRRLDKSVAWLAVIGSAGLWLVGLSFERVNQARLVTSAPTLYPTADGFWPMGCYRNFLVSLAHASDTPIDHNQELWEAWTLVPASGLPVGTALVQSAGLRAYGYLNLRLAGHPYITDRHASDYVLVPGRSLGRERHGFHRDKGERRDAVDWATCWLRDVGGTELRRIYLVEEPRGRTRTLDLRWVAELAVFNAMAQDDSHLHRVDAASPWFTPSSRGHRFAFVYADSTAAEAFARVMEEEGTAVTLRPVEVEVGVADVVVALFVYRGGEPLRIAEEAGTSARWVARSILPAFMSRQNY